MLWLLMSFGDIGFKVYPNRIGFSFSQNHCIIMTFLFQTAKLAKAQVPPSEMFKHETDKYSAFDEQVCSVWYCIVGYVILYTQVVTLIVVPLTVRQSLRQCW